MQIGEIKELEIQDFFELSKEGGIYEIETPDGWIEIGDLFLKKNKECYLIRTSNGLELCGSEDHWVESQDGWKALKDIDVQKDLAYTKNGKEEIVAKEYVGTENTYDLEVLSESHKYYANDIVSHNTGKTMICKVLCQELPITVIYILPSDIREPSDVSRICGMASDLSPTLLVLEDIDYIAEDRSNGSGMAWMTIELMNRLDGLEEMNGVITIATTNLIEKLENAVKNRPGRFDKVITIPEPDASCRKKMIQKFTEKFSIKEVNVDALVKKTKGMLGSYIKHLCEYAAILAIEESSFDSEEIAIITEKHFEEALSEIKNKDFSVAPDYEPKRPMGFGSGPFDDDEL